MPLNPLTSPFASICLAAVLSILLPSAATAQEKPKYDPNKPLELLALDPEIRAMLEEPRASCDQFNIRDTITKIQKALQIADDRGLIRDRALVEATLASAHIGEAKIELAFTTFQRALQDAIDSKNAVLEADILISLASEAQLKGNTLQATDLISRALSISEKSGSLYEKSRALGELGRMKLLLGKSDEAAQSIDEALKIDTLNGYRFEALHLVYRGYYFGLTGKPDQAVDSLTRARTKALSVRDSYSFLMAENSYAFGLVQKGKADEAIADLRLLKQGKFQSFLQDTQGQACLASALELPILHLTLLEGLANVLEAAKQKEKELEAWQEVYSYSCEHSILAGEAEAAQKIANLSNELKRTDDAVKYYGLAINLYRNLRNESLLEQAEVPQTLLLVQLGRGREALPLVDDITSYAKRHNLRSLEFSSNLELAQIYQPDKDLDQARNALENAQALVQPGPFDSEIDNHLILQAYSRLGDIYRAQNLPTKELLEIHKAFFTAVHLKDEKAQEFLVGYLDQRLKDLRIRELVEERQKQGLLGESLLYSYVLYLRDGFPAKPTDDQSNWQRILTLPFLITQKPGGAEALVDILAQIESLVGFEKLPILNALARYYIASGAEPTLAEKSVIEAEGLLKGMKGDTTPIKMECECVLAVAYSRQGKATLANQKIAECLSLSEKTTDQQSRAYAQAANAMVQLQNGNISAARNSLELLTAKAPNDAELHVELAMSLANTKHYDEASSQLDSAISYFNSKGDKKTAGGAYVRVAIALNADSSKEARGLQLRYLSSAERVFHELHADAEEAGVLAALGDYYMKVSQLKSAIEHFEKASEVAEKVKRVDIVAQAMSGLGNAYQAKKDFHKASDLHKKAAEAHRQAKSIVQQVINLESLSEDYAAMNRTDDALSSLLEAKKLASLIPALNQYFLDYFLGEFYRKQGQFDNALAVFREAVEVTGQAGDIEHCAYSHLATGELDGLIGAWEDAVRESEEALKLFQNIDDKKGQAASWADLTGIYSDRSSSVKDFDKAQQCYAKARELGYGETLQLDLMEVYLQTGKYAEAAQIAKGSVQRCTKAANIECQAHGLLSLSEAQRLNGEIRAARVALNQARPVASESQDLYLRGRLLYAEARQLKSEGKLDEALDSYKQLITLIETVKGNLDAKEQKAISENYGYIYDELVSLLHSMSKRDSREQLRLASESLQYAEINKARQFAESWGRTFIDQMRRSLPASVQESERSLFSRRDHILAQLSASTLDGEPLDRDQKEHTEAELRAVQKEISTFLQELRRSAPQYAALAYPEAIQIAAVPLRKGESFVEFKLTDESAFAWIVQNQNGNNELVSFYKVPQSRTWFLDRISMLRKALNSGHPEATDWKISEEMFSSLFPAETLAIISGSEDVIFIPDDVLFALPFELFSPNASHGNFVFLGKASTYFPSAVSFRLARRASHQSSWQEAFLGLGDPITSDEDDRFGAVKTISSDVTQSPVKNGEIKGVTANSSTDPARLKARGFSLGALPGTESEVRNIAALLQKNNEKVEVRIGIDATKSQLLDTDLSKFRFLHFATHGVLPVDAGIREPSLVLSYDGIALGHMFLSMSEILGLRLQAELVVLSACNTGSGSISRAEGVMSLGRAFLAAGSSSVVVSLWQVSDESTAIFMEDFYRNVLEGKRKDIALAAARASLFARGYQQPFSWAPFIVIGE